MLVFFVLSTLLVVHSTYGQHYVQPEQVHLSYGANENEIFVIWATLDAVEASLVEYGPSFDNLNAIAVGSVTKFVDGGSKQRDMYVHRAVLAVRPGEVYFYRCGSPNEAWSSVFHFTAPNTAAAWSPAKIAFYGDLGNEGAVSLPFLQTEVQRKNIHGVIHLGDMAYNLEYEDGKTGDEFMRQLVPIAAHVPYMAVPGNHEREYNFSHYKNRFPMPSPSKSSMFYSFNLGPVHFIALNTENYFYPEYGLETLQTQYNWLLSDLEVANQAKNREKRPWIVVYGHRPLYCSNKGADDCNDENSVMRYGDSKQKVCGFEQLFLDYGVDVYFSGHKHSYERLRPIYNGQVRNGTKVSGQPYNNPKGPVYFISGLAGSINGKGSFADVQPAWSAFRTLNFGYSTMQIFNTTHIHFEHHSVEQEQNKVIDEMWLVKDTAYPSYYKELSKSATLSGLVKGCLTFSFTQPRQTAV